MWGGPPGLQQTNAFQGEMPNTPSSTGISSLRLKLVDEYRVDPPIPMSGALAALSLPGQENTHTAGMPQSLEFEKDIIDKAGQGSNHVEDFFNTADVAAVQDERVKQFTDMGFTRAQASLGVEFCRAQGMSQSDVPDFASNLTQLTGMGYSMGVVVGALAKCKNDATQAAEMCLALPS